MAGDALNALCARYGAVQKELAEASAAGVPPRLIVVSKKRPAADICALIAGGCRDFCENTLQEITAKWGDITRAYPDVRLHFIGRLQRNKAHEVWQRCDAIHSVDRAPLIDALAKAKRAQGKDVPCYLQINIGNEPQKSGADPQDAAHLLAYARAQGLDIVGLMAIPPSGADPAPYFARLAALNGELALPRLSMGMSQDYVCAAKSGATDVRVGSKIFGG